MMYVAYFLVGLAFGVLITNWQWTSKAYGVTRKECMGKLYHVIKEGDSTKFDFVLAWFVQDEVEDAKALLQQIIKEQSNDNN